MLSYHRSRIYEHRYRFSLQHLLSNSNGNNHKFFHIIETPSMMYFFGIVFFSNTMHSNKLTRKLHFRRHVLT